jgi:hypothetical protein
MSSLLGSHRLLLVITNRIQRALSDTAAWVCIPAIVASTGLELGDDLLHWELGNLQIIFLILNLCVVLNHLRHVCTCDVVCSRHR